MKPAAVAMQPVTGSSQVKAIGYDLASATLAVEFSTGAVYHYHGVPASMLSDFNKAKSKGAFLNEHVKGGKFRHALIKPAKGKK